jgi:regulator of protease activity HflC (stomatin/prohibitin superfamily)
VNELIQSIIDFVKGLWPFDQVKEWEAGILIVNGKVKRVLGPGVWFILWWFWELHTISLQPALLNTGRQDVTLKDGSVVTFRATGWARVVDPLKAFIGVDSYKETAQELVTAVVSDKLAMVEASRLEPENRARLLSDLTKWVSKEAEEYGVEISKIRFASFVHRAKTMRIILDRESEQPTW